MYPTNVIMKVLCYLCPPHTCVCTSLPVTIQSLPHPPPRRLNRPLAPMAHKPHLYPLAGGTAHTSLRRRCAGGEPARHMAPIPSLTRFLCSGSLTARVLRTCQRRPIVIVEWTLRVAIYSLMYVYTHWQDSGVPLRPFLWRYTIVEWPRHLLRLRGAFRRELNTTKEMLHSCSTDHISCLVTYNAFGVYRLSSNYYEVPRKLVTTCQFH
jgi:hypothetical protein